MRDRELLLVIFISNSWRKTLRVDELLSERSGRSSGTAFRFIPPIIIMNNREASNVEAQTNESIKSSALALMSVPLLEKKRRLSK